MIEDGICNQFISAFIGGGWNDGTVLGCLVHVEQTL